MSGQPKRDDDNEAVEGRVTGPGVAIALSGITEPGHNDVKFGRGGDTNYHVGNIRFRSFAAAYKARYQRASKEERQVVVQELVADWRAQIPPGRFLARADPYSRENSTWHDVGDEKAQKKAAKVLGEGLGVKRKKANTGTDGSPPKTSRGSPGGIIGVPPAAAVGYAGGYGSASLGAAPVPGVSRSSDADLSLMWNVAPWHAGLGQSIPRTAAPASHTSSSSNTSAARAGGSGNTSSSGRQVARAPAPHPDQQLLLGTALTNQNQLLIPDAASLTAVFGSPSGGSVDGSSDSAEDKK